MRSVLSLYTGVGGLDLGLEKAGFDVAVCVESDEAAVKTLEANRDWTIASSNDGSRRIEDITSDRLRRAAGLKVREGTLLAGGPPCQPFSKSGFWVSGEARRLSDPRANTIREYFRVLRDTLPEVFLLENVPGLKFDGKDEGLAYIHEELEAINKVKRTKYKACVDQLNAADFGVPQVRERVFVVGHRDGRTFEFPKPTHCPALENGQPRLIGEPYRTAWDAIGELNGDALEDSLRMTGNWADLLPSIPEGQNYLWHTPRGGGRPLFGWRKRYWNFLLKLAKNRPAWTIQAQPGPSTGPFHWANRRLSARELCRLQTIPDDYEVSGNIRTVQRLLGNAVPSALAELLGREIRRQLLDEDVSLELELLPARAGHTPSPEPLQPVPARHLELEGDHADHPGTGRGPSAVARQSRLERPRRRA